MEYKDKIFRHNLRKIYRGVLLIVLIAAVALLMKVQLDNRVYTRYETLEKLESVGSENSKFENCNGNLLCYSMDGISAYDKNGRQLWNQTFQMQSVMVKSAGDYVVCADYQGSKVYLIGKNGLICTIDTHLPVLGVTVSAQGIPVALLQEDETVYLRMFAQDGSVIANYRTTMRNFGYPLAYTISPDNIKMGVSFLKAASGKISTSLAFYNFGGVGQNETDNLVSAYECEEEVVPFFVYPNENNALAIGSKKIRLFSGKQKPTLAKEIETDQEINAVFYNRNYFVLVVDSQMGAGRYELRVYDMSGNEKLTTSIDFEYTDIVVEDARILVYNQNRLQIISMNGNIAYNGELGGSIRRIIPVDNYARFLVVYEDKLERIRLR